MFTIKQNGIRGYDLVWHIIVYNIEFSGRSDDFLRL